MIKCHIQLPTLRLSDWSRERCTNPGGVRQEAQWEKKVYFRLKHRENIRETQQQGERNTTDDSTETEPKYQLN